MNAGIYDQTHRPEQLRAQAAVVRAGVLVEADLLTQFLGIESPALGIGGVSAVLAELGQAGKRLLNGDLEMMTGNALMIGDRLVIDEAAMGGVGYGNRNAAGTLAIWRSALVMGGSGSLERRDRARQ